MNYDFNKENLDMIMNQFVQLNLSEQRKQIIDDLNYMILIEKRLCEINGSNFNILYNKEIDDLKKNVVDEKDFLEAVYAYLYILKNGHFNFVESIIHNSVNICDNQ